VGDTPPERLSSLLLDLDLFQESSTAAQKYINKYPNHLISHLNNLNALQYQGKYAEAAQAAQVLAVLHPTDILLQRKLAECLEEGEYWTEALDIRADILNKHQVGSESKSGLEISLPQDDLILFANCAYQSGQHNRAISACNQILAQNPEHNQAYSLKGKVLCEQGQLEDGFAYLNRAVETGPDQDVSWLNLAYCQKNNQSSDVAAQTLRSGLTASNQKSRLLLSLAEIETNSGKHSQALESYQNAAVAADQENIDQKSRYKIMLGEGISYYELGHTDQALKVLRVLNERFPGNQQANFLYGKLLLDLNEAQSALPYLVQVIDQNPDDPTPYLYYADALLKAGAKPDTAQQALTKALEINPADESAQVLQAETYAAAGDHKKALSTFQKAQESSLIADPGWSPRISTGLGKSALKLGEIETAIAALKDGYDRYPHDLRLTRNLAEAYRAGELSTTALECANKAAEIAPLDTENLAWVAKFTLDLGAPEQGISALKKLIQLNPNQANAYILLGKAQASAGNQTEAIKTITSILDLEEVQPEDLLSAGENLIDYGELESAMLILVRAQNICQANPQVTPLLPKIWSKQAACFEASGNTKKALELLDQAITNDLDQPEWRIQKADMLIRDDRFQAALASLANALDLSPDEPALHLKMAKILRQTGSYEEAFHHAQEALSGFQAGSIPASNSSKAAFSLATELARATLRDDTAHDIVSNLSLDQALDNPNLSFDEVHSYCLAGELALDQDQEIKAADISNLLVGNHTDHPRVLVLQARILNRQGNREESKQVYYQAVDKWHGKAKNNQTYHTSVEIALGKTAWELKIWDEAAAHLQHAADLAPQEKRSLSELALFYINRAEIRRLADTLKVLLKAPNIQSTSNSVYKAFLGCVKGLRDLNLEEGQVEKIRKRGDAVFAPSKETADAFKPLAFTPDEVAALIGAYRNCRQLVSASQTAQSQIKNLGQNPALDLQVALALLKINPKQAYKAAASALETARRINDPQIPFYFVGLTLAAKQIDEQQTAEESIQKALSYWGDEPRWYALAAEISDDYNLAVEYFQKAVEMEPEYPGHYLALGRKHLQAKQSLLAINSFEKALSINPELIEAWIEKALAKQSLGRMPEALNSINQALKLSPEHKGARKTAAVLHFENGTYRESERHLVSLLGQNPNDTDLLALFARTLTAQKQSEQALRVIEKAIDISGDPLELELLRAGIIKHISGPTAAVDELRIIGSHHEDRYPLILDLVATLAEAGELDQAIRTAQDVLLKEDLGYTNDQKSYLYLTTGRLLRKSGQLDQAVHHLYKAKKLITPNYQAELELGRVHQERRQFDLALEQMEHAIEIEPREAEAYYHAGRILKDLKKFEQAERMLRKASKLAPNDLKIHRQLGVLVTLNLVHGDPKKEVLV
jgi:tetratricopeptide (TPR) repeat protein